MANAKKEFEHLKIHEFEHLKIHLEELKKATNSFGSKVIGRGGFGKVYEGEVSHSRGRSLVAIKRLSREHGQGDSEFLKEILMLSRYTHENLISLLGFCDEDGERILVYEHASNGSLDRHLNSTILAWTQRLKICLDAAKGLAYLHDHKGTQQRILHRDIKSANILLDGNWNAKLSDMGLSKQGPADQQHTVLFTKVAGTPGYCDPQYMETYTLTKESDIYSFGVLLFEVLCGRLCFEYHNRKVKILVPMWKQSYENKKLDQIIFKDLTPTMDPTALETFSDIAFQCLHCSREQRPTMSLVVEKLELALEFQEFFDMKVTNALGTSQAYSHVGELSKGRRVFLYTTENAAWKLVHFDFDGSVDFTADDLSKATVEITRKSSYGSNSKAKFGNGDEVAVKRLRENITKDHTALELELELNLVGKISHPNLLPMRAYCLGQKGDTFLIFDYMAKGTLADFLHARVRVEWQTTMQIAKGVARGLVSLHTDHNIIHGNLTSSNVLLDENINPKIADFELSRLLTVEDPELKKEYMKDDVYSLGLIMLELLNRKSPRMGADPITVQQMMNLILEGTADNEYIDELMEDASFGNGVEFNRSMELALKCVDPSSEDWPDVQMVVQQLEEIRPDNAISFRMMVALSLQ